MTQVSQPPSRNTRILVTAKAAVNPIHIITRNVQHTSSNFNATRSDRRAGLSSKATGEGSDNRFYRVPRGSRSLGRNLRFGQSEAIYLVFVVLCGRGHSMFHDAPMGTNTFHDTQQLFEILVGSRDAECLLGTNDATGMI